MIIDAKNLVLGRLASYVAKQALMGEDIKIVNCDDAVIVGKKVSIIGTYKQRRERRTPFKGPYLARVPERFVRRAIRGMLPYKQYRGREAFKRIMCYNKIPEDINNKEIITLDKFNVLKGSNINYITIKELCRNLGGK
jgi:large subunit ribosomal protein L13